jgi:hypothetical protein
MARVGPFWAFVLAPIPAALVPSLLSIARRPLAAFLVFLLILWATQLVFGVALRWFLARRGALDWRAQILVGGVMTGLPTAAYLAWALVEPGRITPLIALVIQVFMMVLGAVTGLFHWLLVRGREHDHQKRQLALEQAARFE